MTKKFLLKLLPVFLAISGIINLGNEVKGQSTCATAVTKAPDTLCNVSTYNIADTTYWVKFTANSTNCQIIASPSAQTKPSASIKKIFLYSGNCSNLSQIGYATNDTLNLANTNLTIGNIYYIKITQDAAISGYFDLDILNWNFHDHIMPIFNNCHCIGKNLVYNGDFSFGNTGFTSDYHLDPTPGNGFSDPSYYSITNSAYDENTNWIASGLGGSGNFMAVDMSYNHANNPGHYAIWEQPIHNIKPHQNYVFSFWLNNLDESVQAIYQRPQIQLLINSSLIIFHPSTSPASNTVEIPINPINPDTWVHICGEWNSGNDTIANLVLHGIYSLWDWNDEYASGNDLGIDGIEFSAVNFVSAGNDTTICQGSCATLNATGANTYQWSDGSIQNPHIVCPATTTTYYVTGTAINGCTAMDTVVVNVIPAPDKPTISGQWNTCHVIGTNIITSDTILNYNPNYVYTYNINHSTPVTISSNPFSVNWNNYSSGGMLYVQVTNPLTGCTNIDSLKVFDCCSKGDPNVLADVTLSSPNAIYTGDWFINGQITINANTTFGGSPTCNLAMGPNAKIIVNPGVILTINQSSVLSAYCDIMWDGIYLNGTTSQLVVNNSSIKDAKSAIVSTNGGNYQLSNSTKLENNYRNIVVNTYPSTHPGKVSKTAFKCSSALKPQYPPVVATRTYSGIEINSVSNILIGDTTSWANRNTFYNMDFGVKNNYSNTKIYNNKFRKIDNTGFPNYPPASAAIISIASKFNPGNLTVGGDNVTGSYKTNLFDTCYFGVYADGYQNVTVKKDTFNSATQYCSVYLYSHSSKTLKVLNNVINNGTLGIWDKHCSNSIIDFNENTINNTFYGISAQNVNSATVQKLNIYNNTIYNNTYGAGILTTNILGTSTQYAMISDNRVYINNPGFVSESYGIHVQNCPYATIQSNNISRLSGLVADSASAVKLNGIAVELSPSSTLCSNTISRMGCAIRCYGAMSNTKIKLNSMQRFFWGVRLDNANIGTQGDATYSWRNSWTPATSSNYRIEGFPSVSTNWMYDGSLLQSNMYCPLPYKSIPPMYMTLVGKTSYITSCVVPVQLMKTGPPDQSAVYDPIVNNTYVYNVFPQENRYYDEQFVYTDLNTNPMQLLNLASSNGAYQNFYNTVDAGSIGKFGRIKNAILEGNLNGAAGMNEAVSANTTIEKNRQIVNRIYLNSWAKDRFDFTMDEYTTLKDIASQEPLAGGDAVYSARVMLGFDVENSSSQKEATNSITAPNSSFGKVFPNPAKDEAYINYELAKGQKGELYLYNIAGQQISKINFDSESNMITINTSGLKSGFYIIKINVDNKLIANNKLILMN